MVPAGTLCLLWRKRGLYLKLKSLKKQLEHLRRRLSTSEQVSLPMETAASNVGPQRKAESALASPDKEGMDSEMKAEEAGVQATKKTHGGDRISEPTMLPRNRDPYSLHCLTQAGLQCTADQTLSDRKYLLMVGVLGEKRTRGADSFDYINIAHGLSELPTNLKGRDHEEWREKHLRRELEKIRTDQLFHSSFSQRKFKSGNSAAVSGVPGIGKTTMVQKIVYDWATGKIYPHFQFVFSFKFRDLNTINCRINLRNLILDQYPYFGNILGELWGNPEGLLFRFDGLDEFKDRIDFADNRRNTEPQSMCTDPECWCEVSDIVYSLIQHKLLPGCSVLVTSRPTASHLLEKADVSVWAEILGFVGDERKEYFNKFFEDQTVAAAVFKHVEENEILYTMCYNPSDCWILGLSLGPFFPQRNRKQQQVPKTITQLYSYYIYNILKNHGREIENPRDVLLKLGEMAYTGVSKKKIVFRNGDLIEYNLQPSQFLPGFLMELLERDESAQIWIAMKWEIQE
ncbi:NACHT, LRR and PYD domains-containing protein 3-like [Mustelus asterias]